MSKIKDYLLEREGHDIDILLESIAGIDGYFDGYEFVGGREKAEERIKSFQAETVRGVLERVREGVEKMMVWERSGGSDYLADSGSSGVYNSALSDVLSLLDTNEK